MLDHERLRLLGDVGEGSIERHAVAAGERRGHAIGIEARGDHGLAVTRGECGEVLLGG